MKILQLATITNGLPVASYPCEFIGRRLINDIEHNEFELTYIYDHKGLHIRKYELLLTEEEQKTRVASFFHLNPGDTIYYPILNEGVPTILIHGNEIHYGQIIGKSEVYCNSRRYILSK